MPWEVQFKSDLNGDGGLGLVLVNAPMEVESSVEPAVLMTDSEGFLYIENLGETLAIRDSWGGRDRFQYEHVDEESGSTYSQAPIAVAQNPEETGSFLLMTRHSSTWQNFEGEIESHTDWSVVNIDSQGVFNWDNTFSIPSVLNYESIFRMDFNGDGSSEGLVLEALVYIETDSADNLSEAYLKRFPVANSDPKVPDPDSPSFVEYNNDLYEIQEEQGFAAFFDYSHEDEYYSNKSTLVAVAPVEAEDAFWLAVKHEGQSKNVTEGREDYVNWQVLPLAADRTNSTATIKWEDSAWTHSIVSWEQLFKQDLDGDSYIGINEESLTQVSSDMSGDLLLQDSSEGLYIKDKNGDLTPIVDEWGAMVRFNYFWTDGSNEDTSSPLAIESQQDGSYILIVQRNSKSEGVSNISYETYKLSADGIVNWELTHYTENLIELENDLSADLNNDGEIGYSLNALQIITGDSDSVALAKDSFDNFYIIDSETIMPVSTLWGGSVKLEFTELENGESFSRKAFATVKSVIDENVIYQIFTRLSSTDQNSQEEIYGWEVLKANSKGVIDFEENDWAQSIYKYETSTKEDIDGNGVIGLIVANLIDVLTDTKGVLLKTDEHGNLFINSEGKTFPITSDDGSQVSFSYKIPTEEGEVESKPYAIEKDNNGDFKIAIKLVETNFSNSDKFINWETFKVGANGTIEWKSGAFGPAIASQEKFFAQDLNEDAKIGIKEGDLTALPNDTVGATLKEDGSGGLYIHDQENSESYITIVDESGSQPSFDYQETDKWGTVVSVGHAVEFQKDTGNYLLLIKESFTPDNKEPTSTLWRTYSVSAAGVVNWTSNSESDSIAANERLFKQDIDLSGKIGEDLSSLILLDTDVAGEKPKTDSTGRLFIEKLDRELLKVTDDSGNQLDFDHADVYAVEALDSAIGDGFYLLLKNSGNSSENTVWERLYASADGVIDWTLSRTHRIATWLETDFNQDLDGDGKVSRKGDQIADLNEVVFDITGERLQKTSDGTIFVKDGTNTIQIVDTARGPVNFDYEQSDDGVLYSSMALAVEKQRDGQYSLIVREISQYGEKTEKSYMVFTVSANGILNEDSTAYFGEGEIDETIFAQDINGDGKVVKGSISRTDQSDLAPKKGSEDKGIIEKFSEVAQSVIYTLPTIIKSDDQDPSSSESENVTMFVERAGQGTSKIGLDIKVVDSHSELKSAKIAKDAGVTGITPMSGVMDFSVTISDPKKYGTIVNVIFALPEGTTNPIYMKEDRSSGEFFDFKFNNETREGYIYDNDTNTLTLHIRDNGKHDDDPTLGIVRDPAVLYEGVAESSSDSDGDGIVDSLDYDDDGDGITDDLEQLAGGDPTNAQDTQTTETYLQGLGISYSILASAAELGKQDVKKNPSFYGLELYTAEEKNDAVEAARAIVNVSARVDLGPGGLVTPGFTVLGQQKKMLIRAVGPKLGDLGVDSPMANPTMTVFKARWDGNPPDVVAVIDDWKSDNDNVSEIVSAMESTGAFPLEPAEAFQGRPFMTDDTTSAAALLTLDIGVYTVQVSSADGGTGEVLVEVYEVTGDSLTALSADSDDDGFTDDLESLSGGNPANSSDASITESYLSDNDIPVSIFDSARNLGQQEVILDPSANELYSEVELEAAALSAKALVNVSARVDLGPGGLVTPGFTVLGQQKKMLIRAVGPKLGDLGVDSPMANPTMTVFKARWDGNPPDVVAVIDDWKSDNDNVSEIVSAMESTGAFPLEPAEAFQGRPFMTDDTTSAAALLTLDIGVYTVQVSSADGGTGEVLVEVYEVTE
ncbi:MAG: hypothetical protein ACJ07L_12360 [Opitutales bacterium]